MPEDSATQETTHAEEGEQAGSAEGAPCADAPKRPTDAEPWHPGVIVLFAR
ncbi:MAG: hypothetical protein ACTS22_08115 [Phycisphaerales bacterium]